MVVKSHFPETGVYDKDPFTAHNQKDDGITAQAMTGEKSNGLNMMRLLPTRFYLLRNVLGQTRELISKKEAEVSAAVALQNDLIRRLSDAHYEANKAQSELRDLLSQAETISNTMDGRDA